MVVFAEAFVLAVIVFEHGFACPFRGAFYAEMVVGFHGKFAPPCGGLKQSLGHDYAGGNAVFTHLAHRGGFVFFYVVPVCL